MHVSWPGTVPFPLAPDERGLGPVERGQGPLKRGLGPLERGLQLYDHLDDITSAFGLGLRRYRAITSSCLEATFSAAG